MHPMSRQKQVRVLIAEDDSLASAMIEGILENIGYTVAAKAKDAQETIQLTQSLRPDVVLMDIGLPDMDGIQATQVIHACCPTPVVVLTAHESPEWVEKASAAGVGAYLVKPPRPRDVEWAIIIATARSGDILELRRLNAQLQARNQELQEALVKVKALSGLLPICPSCKKIRDDAGYWNQVEIYVEEHSEAEFTHGLCPDCTMRLYPDLFDD
jgi:DNA-binding NarL/FixJ family response regulator